MWTTKRIRLSFPESCEDVYNLIKTKRHPAKYVVNCVRFFEKHKGEVKGVSEKEPPVLLKAVDIDNRVKEILASSEFQALLKKSFSEEFNKVLESGEFTSVDSKVVEEVVQITTENLSSGPDSLLSVYAQDVSFMGAADMFDDD